MVFNEEQNFVIDFMVRNNFTIQQLMDVFLQSMYELHPNWSADLTLKKLNFKG
jgi:hypothetical protein